MWTASFCGSIGLRVAARHHGAPAALSGAHRLLGRAPEAGPHAKLALRCLIPSEAKAVGSPYVEITTDPSNIASQRVIEWRRLDRALR